MKKNAVLENELFYCEHLCGSANNEALIQKFTVSRETGKGLEAYLKRCACHEECCHEARTYLVKDKDSDDLVAYFSLKNGLVTINEKKPLFRVASFDTMPGIEIANFAVNSTYAEKYNNLEGIGEIVMGDFIFPIIRSISEQTGLAIVFIYALPYPELIDYYREIYTFSRLSPSTEKRIHSRLRPRYDNNCIFMWLPIENVLRKTERRE